MPEAAKPRGIRVTATDLETGATETAEIYPGDYTLICADPCFVREIETDADEERRTIYLGGYAPTGVPRVTGGVIAGPPRADVGLDRTAT